MKAPSKIETARLVLSLPTDDDVRPIFERYASDPDVVYYLGWPRHRTIEDTMVFIDFSKSQWKENGIGPYLIRDREDGLVLGSTGLTREKARDTMTGYVFAKDAWGHGYATETVHAMVSLASQLSFESIFALCHPDHGASQRVLQKSGFVVDPNWNRSLEFPNFAPGVLQKVVCYRRSL